MQSSYVGEAISVIWTGVTAGTLCLAARGKVYRKFPALVGYLALCFLFGISFGILPYGPLSIPAGQRYVWYFWGYEITYVIGAVLLLFVVQQVFSEVMAPLPGLRRIGLLALRWVVSLSLIVAMASSYMPIQLSKTPLVTVTLELARYVSIMQFCLLAFVALIAKRLALPYGSRAFGIATAFGMMAGAEFAVSAFAFRSHSVFSSSNIGLQVCNVVGILICAGYFVRPEPVRSPMLMAPTSTLLRWNEVAMALGRSGVPAEPDSAPAFFLTDVERVVDKVLSKNSLKV